MTDTYELNLLKQAKEGNRESENEFIKNNIGLVHLVVKRFLLRGSETEDLVQIGMLGLYKAMKNFDFSYDVKFSTYAVPMITGEIKRYLRDDGIIKVSRTIKEMNKKIKFETEKFEKENQRQPSLNEISQITGISKEDIIMSINSSDNVVSLDETATKEDEKLLLINKIADVNAYDETKIVDKIAIKEMISKLKPKERQVIILRYFKEMTQENIAKMIGVSQVQVCRIEKKVLSKLKASLNDQH